MQFHAYRNMMWFFIDDPFPFTPFNSLEVLEIINFSLQRYTYLESF